MFINETLKSLKNRRTLIVAPCYVNDEYLEYPLLCLYISIKIDIILKI